MPPGGGGGAGRNSDGNHRLQYPPCPSKLLQVPCESPLGVRRRLSRGGAQPLEGTTEVGEDIQGVEQGGRGCPDIGNNLRGGG